MTIFLDIDGVLNQLQPYKLDEKCIINLANLCINLDANIVLTSSWRLGFTHNFSSCSPQVQELRQLLKHYGVDISGRTKSLGSRYFEIECYIKEYNISEYIILDDDKSEFVKSDKNLYLINYKTGLTCKDVEFLLRRYK